MTDALLEGAAAAETDAGQEDDYQEQPVLGQQQLAGLLSLVEGEESHQILLPSTI